MVTKLPSLVEGNYWISCEQKNLINVEAVDNKWVITYDHYENRNHSFYGLSTGADNLVDTCYEMIIKLHEQNLL